MALSDLIKKRGESSAFAALLNDPIRRNEVLKAHINELVKQYVDEFKQEATQEIRRILEEKVGQDGLTTLKGERGYTAQKGVDYLTPEEMAAIKAEITPQKGTHYFDGEQGTPGTNGLNGINGQDALHQPDRIATALNTLTEKIEIKVIKGLRKEIERLGKEIQARGGGGGGGGGNWQHESKSVTSATTTITTNFKIGGGGYAILGFYQGQMIVRGTHYTVGSDRKTLTLTFTPTDSATIDLVYQRA